MKYLEITNKGMLDIRLIALMGGTTKENDLYKIGHFGTGLKYTLAYLFRTNTEFKIFVGKDEVNINLEYETIGEERFEIICINGHRTSITTKMGNDWEAWMIIRELYSNALDEGEATYQTTENINPVDGVTSFYLELKPEIMEVYNNWNDYFIVGKETFYQDEKIKLFPQTGNLRVYKQGILIYKGKKPSLFNYDISDASINELREYKGFLEGDISGILFNLKDKKVIQYFVENLKEDHYEASIDYDYDGWYQSFSKEWEEAMEGTQIIHQEAMDNLQARGIQVDTASNIVVPENLYKGLTRKFEGIGALRVSKEVNDFYEIYNEALHDRIIKAQKLLEEAGYYIEPELSYVFGIFGDERVMAKVSLDDKKIYMSEKHLDSDLFSICTTLIEENEHYKTGLSDETREFQQHFINLYTNQLIEKSKVDLL